MTTVLNDLLRDIRLKRLFSQEDRDCALQLWILHIKSRGVIENRLIYGRLLPYNHSSNSWSFSDNNHFETFGSVKTQVARLNLYIKSSQCEELIKLLAAGQSIAVVSERLGLKLAAKLEARFGDVTLAAQDLVYRPVAYLLNRDAHAEHSLLSPHGGAGAYSAAITQISKGILFRLGPEYVPDLAKSVIEQLNKETGLNFGEADLSRLGDIELLVFPALDDSERQLLSVNWADSPHGLVVRFNPMQVPHFDGFQFRLNIENGGLVAYSGVSTAECGKDGVFECKFELDEHLHARTDSTELEIFGLFGNRLHKSMLCCRWKISYVREIHIQSHPVGSGHTSVKFDWLENTTRQSISDRIKAALTINRGELGFANRIGGRQADPWVPVNRDLISLLAQLNPPKSEARFFQRWSEGDGEGRLQFVEWFKALLQKYQHHQVAIFDPYFDEAGLGLVLICAASGADYIVFTSLPKSVGEDRPTRRKSDGSLQQRMNNLLANCERNYHLLKNIKLRMYGLKEGRLHDRYILIKGSDGLPVAGFNLSNSLQKAAENYPLLVTPIPADTLLQVEQYKLALMRKSTADQADRETDNSILQCIFDSTELRQSVQPRYEPLGFLEKAEAGNALSFMTGEESLRHLSGHLLSERMTALGMLEGDSLQFSEATSLKMCLDHFVEDFTNFTAIWKVLGDVLAHSRIGDSHFHEVEFRPKFLEFLAQFLDESFNDADEESEKELAVVDMGFFQKPVEELLYSSYRPDLLYHPTKYTALTWAEFYAIKLLWWYAPEALLATTEVRANVVPSNSQISEARRLSLLSQIVSEISLSIQFNINERQRDQLVRSENGLLQWMGLNAIEMQLKKPEGLAIVLQLVSALDYPERVRALGWMINHAAKASRESEISKGLIAALHDILPPTISAERLAQLINSMRGHMKELAWTEPWLFQDVIHPLLEKERANIDDACDIWVCELTNMLGKKSSLLFESTREGQTTNIAAFLFSHSSFKQQQTCLKSIHTILKIQKRTVQQPLASTSNWSRWDDALTISMWILAFTQWCRYYQHGQGLPSQDLMELSRDAHAIAMIRPMEEWKLQGTGRRGELALFFEQAERLVASNDA